MRPRSTLRALGTRTLGRFVEIEGSQQATVLAAQAFTSLLPFLVVVAAFAPGEGNLADRLVERFGLDGPPEQSLRALFNSAGETRGAIPWVSLVILVLASTSFSRAMQRMFERAYGAERGKLKDSWRALAWLGGFAAWVAVSGPLRSAFEVPGQTVLALLASSAMGFGLWLGTPMILLRGFRWRELVPGAVAIALLASLTSIGSAVYLPILITQAAERYGLIGVALSMQSWLLVMSFVVVLGAAFGGAIGELRAERRGNRESGGASWRTR